MIGTTVYSLTSHPLYKWGPERTSNLPKGTQPVVVLKTKPIAHLLCGFFIEKLPTGRSHAAASWVTDNLFSAPLLAPESRVAFLPFPGNMCPFQQVSQELCCIKMNTSHHSEPESSINGLKCHSFHLQSVSPVLEFGIFHHCALAETKPGGDKWRMIIAKIDFLKMKAYSK